MNLKCFLGFHKFSSTPIEPVSGFFGWPCTNCSYVKLLEAPSILSKIQQSQSMVESSKAEVVVEELLPDPLTESELPPPPKKKESKKAMIKVGSIGHKTVQHTVTFSNQPPELISFVVRFRVTKVEGKFITTSIISISGGKEPQNRQVVMNNWVETFDDLRGIQWE